VYINSLRSKNYPSVKHKPKNISLQLEQLLFLKVPNVDKDVEKKHSCIIDGNVNWSKNYGKQSKFSLRNEKYSTI
jgi:hypothetical protein